MMRLIMTLDPVDGLTKPVTREIFWTGSNEMLNTIWFREIRQNNQVASFRTLSGQAVIEDKESGEWRIWG